MLVKTLRFGDLEVEEKELISFVEGILGFEDVKKYILLTKEGSSFSYLQAVEVPELTFVLIRPGEFFADYEIELSDEQAKALEVTKADEVAIYALVAVPQNLKEMTVNLQGPIIINANLRTASQIVVHNLRYHTKHRLFPATEETQAGGGR